ncbi:hypothetical protein D9M71_466010 [compost metagenome]
MPGTGQGHHAVDHSAPTRRQQDQRHGHAQRLRPVRQRGVVQVVRAGPDVQGDQRPEVHNRQAIGIHRPARLFRHEVIHHPQETGGQEKAHGVVPVPPLHHGVGGPGIHRIGLEPVDWNRQVIDHVQHGDDHDECTEKPVADVDVSGLALHYGSEEHHGVRNPDHGHPHRAGEFDFGVFLGGGVAQRQGDQHHHNHRLPAPEREGSECVREQPHLAGTLHRVIAGGELRAAGETENHQAGVQRAQAAEGGPRQVQVHLRPHQLRGDPHAHRHPHDAPDYGRHDELADDLVVIGLSDGCCAHGQCFLGCNAVHCKNTGKNKTGSGKIHLCGSDFSPLLRLSVVF